MGDIEQERYYGNREYKLKLVNPSEDRVIHLTTQMKFRIQEGKGEAFYEIGVKDDGEAYGLSQREMEASLRTLHKMASKLEAELIILSIRKGKYGEVATLMVRKNIEQGLNSNIKIVLLGDTTAGKSTLLGVMVSGRKDDGKGSARQKAFKHAHELSNDQ